MEEEENFDMGELRQPLQRLSREFLGEDYASFLPAPEVIVRVGANRFNKPDCFNLLDQRARSLLDD